MGNGSMDCRDARPYDTSERGQVFSTEEGIDDCDKNHAWKKDKKHRREA